MATPTIFYVEFDKLNKLHRSPTKVLELLVLDKSILGQSRIDYIAKNIKRIIRSNIDLNKDGVSFFVHNDQGSHYTSLTYQNIVKVFNLRQSML